MTKMLASVNSLIEARLILNSTADIIDLKQPQQGALGALSTNDVREIVSLVNNKKPVSATIGDLPMQADLIFNAVSAMSETGVDYIKIGLFPGGDLQGTLSKLSVLSKNGNQLIAVLFADQAPDFHIIELLKKHGFSGVMLDTMKKSSGSLPQLMPYDRMEAFVKKAKQAELLSGLAGSLKAEDIPELLPLNTDYLGFRGALCEEHNRTAALHEESINKVLSYF